MTPNLDVVYRDIDSSSALTQTITEKYNKLSKFSDSIVHSKITLDSPHKHKGKGRIFRASIEMNLKGKPFTVSQDDESVHVAVRDAFDAAERKLKSVVTKARAQRHH